MGNLMRLRIQNHSYMQQCNSINDTKCISGEKIFSHWYVIPSTDATERKEQKSICNYYFPVIILSPGTWQLISGVLKLSLLKFKLSSISQNIFTKAKSKILKNRSLKFGTCVHRQMYT